MRRIFTLYLLIGTIFFINPGFSSGSTPKLSPAPELLGGPWLNTQMGNPILLSSRRGKPTLVAFWNYGCSNCRANFPVYSRLLAKYRSKGVSLISIHTPEEPGERALDRVKRQVVKEGINYPVLIDNDFRNWNRWKVQAWPTLFLLDGAGVIRERWEGELNWQGSNGEATVASELDQLLAVRK